MQVDKVLRSAGKNRSPNSGKAAGQRERPINSTLGRSLHLIRQCFTWHCVVLKDQPAVALNSKSSVGKV